MKTTATILASIASIAMLAASPALADPITLDSSDIGSSFSVSYDGFAGGSTVDGLGAETTFTLTNVTSDSYTFDYLVGNTTDSGVTSRISSFAFNTNPEIAGASSTGEYNYTILDSRYPNGIGTVDVCFKGGRSGSCAGNSGGVTEGNTGAGSLTLSFADPISSLTLDDFFVRYQSITGAGHVTSASGQQTSSSTSGGTEVPEPGMLGLFGLGLIGAAFLRRRRKTVVNARLAYA